MDVIVTGRRCTISDDFREKVAERITGIERFRDRVQRVEVQVSTNQHKQPDQAIQVEITLIGKGPVVRSVASADDKSVAFEHALDKMKAQLRRAADRRKVHRGLRVSDTLEVPATADAGAQAEDGPQVRRIAGLEVTGDGPLVVREKIFPATPLTLAQALDEMELVGHDFFLYVDAESGAPSVVYRRKAYDYGVIHLDVDGKE
ncbi:ribosome-associated translation inhibitor RaiA [Propioniciclava sp. MC1683]|uniref:ribosome hibernation-promoting factor, HPF/YfiA family n=1 Tax=Propioniciclava sp. MC1683 TaxID=2760309 RepID=UPI001602A3FB|nr:ribosome-associated translation inhibitor RaiA [Propioniciclava sp. MC1683]MBB1502195.1 ribosome-associated translation inhibitor RaiA [Propioniciclava sp. MC1683]NLE18782.1 ribosome-associated translation inhibitor RaiA [Propioniciclava sp.]